MQSVNNTKGPMDRLRGDFSVKSLSFASDGMNVQPANSAQCPESTYTGVRNIAYRAIKIVRKIGTTTGGTNHARIVVFLCSHSVWVICSHDFVWRPTRAKAFLHAW
jgi:hypothetical protein